MKTHNLRINQLSPEGFDWYKKYLAALDAKDVEMYGSFLAESCSLQLNNVDPVVGKESMLSGLAQYWQSFGTLEHDLLNIYGTDTSFMLEALNHYQRYDGGAVTLRAVALTDRDEAGKVTSVRLYTDMSPLFASAT